jgi:hypothetical protein
MDIDDEEELLLYLLALHRRKHAVHVLVARAYAQPERPLVPDVRFTLGDMADANCRLDFRFDKTGIRQLFVALRLQDVVITTERDSVCGIEALCIVLFRLVFPKRYHDSMSKFGRCAPSLARISCMS